MQTIEEMKITA